MKAGTKKIPPAHLGADWQAHPEGFQFLAEWMSEKTSFCFQTSGSTGPPKEITVSRNQIEASARATIKRFKLGSRDHALVCIPTHYVGGKMMLIRALIAGMEITLGLPSKDPLLAFPEAHSFTFTAMVPMQLEEILNREGGLAQIKRFKVVLLGGAPASTHVEEICKAHALPVWQTYGMTETVSHVALRNLGANTKTYHRLQGVEIGINEENCLWIKGPMTDGKIIQTTDIVEMTGKKSFIWKGRADFVINSGGLKLHPERIEKAIEEMNILHVPFLVVAEQDRKLGQKAVLLLESERPLPNESEVLVKIKKILGSKYAPKVIRTVPQLKYTDSGKVDRKAYHL
jgi:O-succinylbenzoic acid--CoA ligase